MCVCVSASVSSVPLPCPLHVYSCPYPALCSDRKRLLCARYCETLTDTAPLAGVRSVWVCASDWVICSPLATVLSPLHALTPTVTSCSPNVRSVSVLLSVWLLMSVWHWHDWSTHHSAAAQGVVLSSKGNAGCQGHPCQVTLETWGGCPGNYQPSSLPLPSHFTPHHITHLSHMLHTNTPTRDIQSTGAFIGCK